jgi:tetratricopeptide (TPR) repeat protein/DNA-binding winged helix-turn-helix (wHTH) protein
MSDAVLQTSPVPDSLALPHCTLDLVRGRVVREDDSSSLSTVELQLLRYLVSTAGQAVSRYRLLEEVWGYDSSVVVSRAADTAVCRLRRKIEQDAADPHFLLTVSGVGYRFVMPSERPATPATRRTNLWSDAGAFVGRELERAWLRARVDAGGGVSVLRGPPGIGKTRLAVQVGRERVEATDAPSGGVWFVDLAGARATADVVEAVAWLLDVAVDPASEAAAGRVGVALGAAGPVLFILDNAEHVDGPLHALVPGWLAAAPEAHLVVTTQVRTRLGGATERVLAPLPTADARRLLVDRARLAGAAVPGDGEGGEALERVVARLQGVPLALELAAAQLPMVSADALADRLARGGLALPAGRGGGLTSLRRAIGLAWDRLSDDEQTLLVACSLFEGGFTRRAVEAVSGESSETAARLGRLVDRSLVALSLSEDGGVARYHLLDSIRAFARSQLPDMLLEAPLRTRHARWFHEQATRWAAGLHGPRGTSLLRRLHDEGPNILVAWGWLRDADPSAAAELALARIAGARARGASQENRKLLEAVLEDQPAESASRARALEALAWHLRSLGDADAGLSRVRESVAVAEVVDDPSVLARCLGALADHLRLIGGQAEAEAVLRRALFAAARSGAPHDEARVRSSLGLCLVARGAFEHAQEELESARSLFRACGDLREEGVTWSHLASLAGRRWDHAEAARCHEQALRIHLETGNLHHASISRLGLAMRRIDAGDVPGAEAVLGPVLARERRTGNQRLVAFALAAQAAAAHERGALTETLRLLDAAESGFQGRDRLHVAATWATRGVVLLELGRRDDAAGALDAAVAVLEQIGDGSLLAFASAWAGVAAAQQGRLDTASTWLDRAAEHARDGGIAAQLALQDILRGHLDLARAAAARQGASVHLGRARERAEMAEGQLGSHHRIAQRVLLAAIRRA